ncbi:zinc finger matrin-type protein 1-like isoform X2 [Sitophilus oryzae]|uniref:Zinc finger matrin-type protein 1-like isoform X2 n=1 Tax=Sitophilus oryzae TaxID=7048 RepID=A0A6J2YWW3_SITOR|nr:zinc finger matrin-type protein 1-like isoform X2 [Sitophilus oryzae]
MMKITILYGIIISLVILNSVRGDKRWKNNDENNLTNNEKSPTKKKLRSEDQIVKHSNNDEPNQKRFIGRIEHGKVKVLRRKSENEKHAKANRNEDEFCRNENDKNVDCTVDSDNDESSSSEELTKPKRKIKYSIKFQHEKQKKKQFNGDVSIMRLHKNERKYSKYEKDEDSMEEDESPIKKRFNFLEDEED